MLNSADAGAGQRAGSVRALFFARRAIHGAVGGCGRLRQAGPGWRRSCHPDCVWGSSPRDRQYIRRPVSDIVIAKGSQSLERR